MTVVFRILAMVVAFFFAPALGTGEALPSWHPVLEATADGPHFSEPPAAVPGDELAREVEEEAESSAPSPALTRLQLALARLVPPLLPVQRARPTLTRFGRTSRVAAADPRVTPRSERGPPTA